MNTAFSRLLRGALLCALGAAGPAAFGQGSPSGYHFRDVNVRNQANNVLTLMTFTVVPDVTTSTLSINAASSGNPALTMFTLGGGATVSRELPVYLEGVLGFSRYDPRYVVSDGTATQTLPVRWNSLSLSGGIGWDFHLTDELSLRPIVNIALGQVVSDLSALALMPDLGLGTDLMVGFPGEDEQAFANTMHTAGRLPFAYFHVFSYSSRPGTPAARFEPQTPPTVIRQRSKTLAELSRSKALAFYQQQIGRTVSVLFEQGERDGFRTGTTANFTRVAVAADMVAAGSIHPVTITGIMDGLAYGHLASPSVKPTYRPLL